MSRYTIQIYYIEILLVDARLGPGLSSTSALNKIKKLQSPGSDHIVMIVWKYLVLLYELDFTVKFDSNVAKWEGAV